MTTLISIDPGPEESGVVILEGEDVLEAYTTSNGNVLNAIHQAEMNDIEIMAIEMVASYGMPVGEDVFNTCVWIGRFYQTWTEYTRSAPELVYRKDVKMHLCGTTRAKDANIRQALIDRYGPGKDKAIGKKASPGPLYGIHKHAWSALAVGVTHMDKIQEVA